MEELGITKNMAEIVDETAPYMVTRSFNDAQACILAFKHLSKLIDTEIARREKEKGERNTRIL